jgi:mannose-1-phosphate guanylyltransferase
MYAVILAGGGGTRLHPLSRPERPKPVLPLLGDRSLLQATVARLDGLTDDITIVTDRRYERLVREQVPSAALVLEPLGRNTAAAIALATLVIERPDEEVMAVLAADQTVERTDVFREVLRTAADHLATGAIGIKDPLVTLGIRVDRPATDYGYLIPDVARGAHIDGLNAYPLTRFEEKPKPARAEELAKDEGVARNAGIFLWRRRAIGQALTR